MTVGINFRNSFLLHTNIYNCKKSYQSFFSYTEVYKFKISRESCTVKKVTQKAEQVR